MPHAPAPPAKSLNFRGSFARAAFGCLQKMYFAPRRPAGGGAIQAHQRHRLEVKSQHLAQRRSPDSENVSKFG